MNNINSKLKDKIKNIEIIGVIERYISLKRRGANWVGLCPFHTEKTPSFYVSEKKRSFKCFGCGKHGDAINFIRLIENISFKDALKKADIDFDSENKKELFNAPPPPPRKLHLIDPKFLQQSLKGYNNNCFISYLHTIFEADLVNELATKKYYIGTSKSIWNGATVFWQVDKNLKIRQAKAILYNPENGKRRKWKRLVDHQFLKQAKENWIVKNKADAISFGKRLIKKSGIKEPSIIPCFFGEHLVEKSQKIAIVESEKTAILMAGFGAMGMPVARNFTWIATGGANGISFENKSAFKVLEGKNVVLFPDLGKFEDWTLESLFMENINLEISDILERLATPEDIKKGLDIADFILREYEKGLTFNPAETETEPEESPSPAIPKIISKTEEVFQMMKSQNSAVLDLLFFLDTSIEEITVSRIK